MKSRNFALPPCSAFWLNVRLNWSRKFFLASSSPAAPIASIWPVALPGTISTSVSGSGISIPSTCGSRGVLAIDADDDDIELSVPLGARFNGRAVGGDTESGVGAWLYTLSDERDGAECSTGGISRDGEGCGSGVPTREGVLERVYGVCGVFDILILVDTSEVRGCYRDIMSDTKSDGGGGRARRAQRQALYCSCLTETTTSYLRQKLPFVSSTAEYEHPAHEPLTHTGLYTR